ncbi:hypothetical protein VOLCADRAFT_95178 [Volvox carteri f. nagariensis]|uniref:N-acetyltransferase domain-containing protein n=1 Tax=Volvox carteri f. nagariensis TaxID=3068 RepID=D8U6T8_VOLCA|nr:uncharacterized protein VOLCADRAFT_95178 [Volvox carteri f. nagariensis]EFJ44497.1 hypothetical protein VOLCADRAFT_95178 [Volvox carteri f. nagariensis]|eukprot:XP_002954347.1 hypothetical protein VOLCADRAFT_95178 [Volvox carteri f. nagariensis]
MKANGLLAVAAANGSSDNSGIITSLTLKYYYKRSVPETHCANSYVDLFQLQAPSRRALEDALASKRWLCLAAVSPDPAQPPGRQEYMAGFVMSVVATVEDFHTDLNYYSGGAEPGGSSGGGGGGGSSGGGVGVQAVGLELVDLPLRERAVNICVLGVLPSYRHRGLARLMLRQVVDSARTARTAGGDAVLLVLPLTEAAAAAVKVAAAAAKDLVEAAVAAACSRATVVPVAGGSDGTVQSGALPASSTVAAAAAAAPDTSSSSSTRTSGTGSRDTGSRFVGRGPFADGVTSSYTNRSTTSTTTPTTIPNGPAAVAPTTTSGEGGADGAGGAGAGGDATSGRKAGVGGLLGILAAAAASAVDGLTGLLPGGARQGGRGGGGGGGAIPTGREVQLGGEVLLEERGTDGEVYLRGQEGGAEGAGDERVCSLEDVAATVASVPSTSAAAAAAAFAGAVDADRKGEGVSTGGGGGGGGVTAAGLTEQDAARGDGGAGQQESQEQEQQQQQLQQDQQQDHHHHQQQQQATTTCRVLGGPAGLNSGTRRMWLAVPPQGPASAGTGAWPAVVCGGRGAAGARAGGGSLVWGPFGARGGQREQQGRGERRRLFAVRAGAAAGFGRLRVARGSAGLGAAQRRGGLLRVVL